MDDDQTAPGFDEVVKLMLGLIRSGGGIPAKIADDQVVLGQVGMEARVGPGFG